MTQLQFFKPVMPPVKNFETINFSIAIEEDNEDINLMFSITLSVITLSVIYFLLFPFFMKMISPSEERIREDNNPVMRATFG